MAMKRVTADDIKLFNELYYKYKTFAAVARETGFTAATVSKYVDKGYKPLEQEKFLRFDRKMMPKFSGQAFRGVENYGELCVLSEEEQDEIHELWKELAV